MFTDIQKAAKDALEVYNNGAVNPTAICNSMSAAITAARVFSGTEMKCDAYAPVRLMMAQLWFLAGKGIGNYDGVEKDIGLCELIVNGDDACLNSL